MATGANSTPLGRLNPVMQSKILGTTVGHSLLKPNYIGAHGPGSVMKREYSMEDDLPYMQSPSRNQMQLCQLNSSPWNSDSSSGSNSSRNKKRRSRWGGDDKDKTFIPGMPTVLPNNLSKEQEIAYLLQLQIEEISRRLRTGDLGIPPNPEERSPSPEPIYNNEGKRLNTREYRTRKRLEDERHQLIQSMYDVNPEFKPPADYKPPIVRVSDKVMIPQEEHPDINFVGLLIGPRGNTLKAMEKDTGAKIIIRGKGSVKEGKVGRKDGQPLPGEDEPLHAYVTANNPESVKKAVEKIKEIIRQGVEVPEGQNDLRRMQLRELALLNGTLRENDGPRCSNCGATTHKSWQCPDKPNVTNNVICTNCGGAGHIAKDCRERRPGNVFTAGNGVDKAKIDEEYMSLMAELGEGPPPPAKSSSSSSISHSGPSPLAGPQAPPRAIMAPPPVSQPAPTPPQTQPTPPPQPAQQPPSLMSQPIVPPWLASGNPPKPPSLMNLTTMPPGTQPPSIVPPPCPPASVLPNSTAASQTGLPPWQQLAQSQSAGTLGGVPPPMLLSQPPPPPPSCQPPTTMGMPWLTAGLPQGVAPPWQQPGMGGVPPPPGPVPPPRSSGPVPPPGTSMPWQQGFLGVPPPPIQPPPLPTGVPPPPPPSQLSQAGANNTSAVDLSALAQVGLPNLLAAPPPPPPS